MKRRELLMGLPAALVTAQMPNQVSLQRRRVVVPQDAITRFQLRPAEAFGLAVLGEDNRLYSVEDVLAVLFEMTREHWALPTRK